MTDITSLDILNDIPIRDTRGRFSHLLNTAAAPTQSSVATDVSISATTEAVEINDLVQKISANGAVTMGDEVMERRLRNIVAVFVKGVRDQLQTREALQRSRANGGLALSEIAADLVMQLLMHRPVAKPATVQRSEVVLPVIPLSPNVRPSKPHQFTQTELEHELAPPPPAVIDRTRPLPKPIAPSSTKAILRNALHITKQAVMPRVIAELSAKPFANRPLPPIVRPLSKPTLRQKLGNLWHRQRRVASPAISAPQAVVSATAKYATERITDIRPPSRLVNPVEELRRLRLVDWRALGDPLEAINRIWDKIKLIGKESFTQQLAARTAWRASEVHRLYLAISKEAVEQRMSIDAIIAARKQSQQPDLTSEEYTALAKLSRMLEY